MFPVRFHNLSSAAVPHYPIAEVPAESLPSSTENPSVVFEPKECTPVNPPLFEPFLPGPAYPEFTETVAPAEPQVPPETAPGICMDYDFLAFLLATGAYLTVLAGGLAWTAASAFSARKCARAEAAEFREWKALVQDYPQAVRQAELALQEYGLGPASADLLVSLMTGLSVYLDRQRFPDLTSPDIQTGKVTTFRRRPVEDLWERFARQVEARLIALESHINSFESRAVRLSSENDHIRRELATYARTLDESVSAESRGVYAYRLRRLIQRLST